MLFIGRLTVVASANTFAFFVCGTVGRETRRKSAIARQASGLPPLSFPMTSKTFAKPRRILKTWTSGYFKITSFKYSDISIMHTGNTAG